MRNCSFSRFVPELFCLYRRVITACPARRNRPADAGKPLIAPIYGYNGYDAEGVKAWRWGRSSAAIHRRYHAFHRRYHAFHRRYRAFHRRYRAFHRRHRAYEKRISFSWEASAAIHRRYRARYLLSRERDRRDRALVPLAYRIIAWLTNSQRIAVKIRDAYESD